MYWKTLNVEYFLKCSQYTNSKNFQQSRVITLCAYRDVSGMFTTENKANFLAKEEAPIRTQSETETIIQDIRYPFSHFF